ncbi:uncharacterized protein LOC129574543 isoform X2 [Sitodiplosis mosellana]|uniref:uncharacterized protein LOC129574543 isoform X2 n=1 Tax=Sitodiplosis mosellana TaxID=263140 RepID=UPI0024437D56|nr:uncharacterized protein LOC129574543 isoform X2 [Sitodiplosis mosellana]
MHRNDFDPSTIATISSSDVSTTAATALVENIKNILKKLSNATSECSNRTELLAAAWLNLQNLIQTNSEHFERWMQYIVKCTLESMLMDCTKTDVRDLEQLKTRINECAPLLEKYTNIYYRCKYIVENINEPWSHPTLKLIFNDGNQAPTTISDEQLNKEIEYFSIERGCMIEMRARKLIETKCDRLAMNFVTEALRVIQMCTDEHVLRRTVSLGHNQTLLEIYFSLMYKFKESSRLKTELEAMELESVKEFIINSFATIDAHVALTNRKKSIAKPKTGKKEQLSSAARLHKYHLAVSQYALQLILVRILSGEYTTNGLENIFRRLLIEWIRRNKDLTNFEELFQKLIQTAASNSQIYDCCEILFEMYPNDCETALRVFCSELTKEINVLEHKKYDETVDASVILDLEKQTSIRYLYLGQLLHGHPNLEKECILTAFSMNPTYECFQLVCKLAASEQSATEAATMAATTTETTEMTEMTETTAITSHNESIDALPTITSSDLLLNSKEYDALRAPNRLLDSLTCLSENVRSDLVCLLTVPRIKNLNWLVPWLDLKKECEELLVTEKKMQIVENTTASANDKLKFINLNYDDFKDFTPHEYPGIEKGYEIYVADSDSEESVQLVPNKHGDDSDIEIGGGNASEVDTDTAPESKEFIVKEAKRLRARKRRLIQRSQKLLEESENAVQIKKEPNDGDQQKKKQKLPRPMNSDSLKKPNRKPRKRPLKKEKSGEENVPSIPTIKTEPDTDQLIVDIKLEPTDIDIKQEPVDDDTKFDCDEDVSRTFADLSNMQQFNGANFPLTNHFYSVVSKSEPADEMTKSNGIQSMLTTNGDSNHEPLSNFSQLTYPPNQFEQTCTATAIATDDDSNLVNSIIMAAPELQIQAHEQTPPFPLICDDGDFDEDEKVDMQFQNIVGNMNKLLGLNSTQISYLTNDATINSMQSVQESESQSPVINELCPLTQQPPVSDVPVVDEPVVDVPIVDVLVVDVPVVDVPVVNVLVYDEPVVDEPVVDVPVVNVLVYDEPVVDVPVIDVPVVDVPVVDVPVIKPTPNMPVIETDSVMTLDSNSKSSCDVPSALNATNSVIGVQSPKPKNPLMAFRKPKKTTTIKPNDAATVDSSNGQSKDSIATNSPLIASHANAFSIEGNLNVDWTSTSLLNQDDHRNGSTGNLVHGNQYDLPSCNIITTTALSNGQCTERLEKPLILTKHCTVRLNRIPKLDQLSGQDTVYLRELKQPNDVIDNKKETIPLSMADSKANTKSVDADAAAADCDQATNETSSADKTPPSSSPSSSPSQTNQNAMESGGKNAQTAEEDEDEDRKTNHLYPYSSISSSHNHNGNDDDDDCNSSEDTKTSCPGECISLKTEQHNGQQQQQQKQQQQRQQERSNSGERNQHEHQKQHSGMPQNVSNEMQLCARQSFLMQNHTVSSANVVKHLKCR